MWSGEVDEPFRSDARFWRCVWLSLTALVAVVAAAVVTGVAGRWGAALFAVPVLLLAFAARDARASSAATRPTFPTREEWRDAERRAVASALARGARRPADQRDD
jgi:hypothetical protein